MRKHSGKVEFSELSTSTKIIFCVIESGKPRKSRLYCSTSFTKIILGYVVVRLKILQGAKMHTGAFQFQIASTVKS